MRPDHDLALRDYRPHEVVKPERGVGLPLGLLTHLMPPSPLSKAQAREALRLWAGGLGPAAAQTGKSPRWTAAALARRYKVGVADVYRLLAGHHYPELAAAKGRLSQG
jgi:hypothetical protein